MDARMRLEMKIPSRPAPPLPSQSRDYQRSRDLLSMGNDPFSKQYRNSNVESTQETIRKKPPRPPPPRNNAKMNKTSANLLDIFGRSKEHSRGKASATAIVRPLPPVKGEVVVDALIDLHSPSNSPTFVKSSSFNSIDSTSTSHPFSTSSRFESGFEDDFDSYIASNCTTPSNDLMSEGDPFSPIGKLDDGGLEQFELSNEDPTKAKAWCQGGTNIPIQIRPTIIRAKTKPIRPPPPNHMVGKMTAEGSDGGICLNWVSSPPMPTVPPPPPPPELVHTLINGPPVPLRPSPTKTGESKTPYCVAEYDYEATHPEDLSFHAGDIITLINEVNSDWMKGTLNTKEGIFPANYVKVVIPLSETESEDMNMLVISLYPFVAETWDDLDFQEGEEIRVIRRINKDWLYGECNGRRGQFPESFVQDITGFVAEGS